MKVRAYVNFLDDRRGMVWAYDFGSYETGGTVRGIRLHGVSGRAVTKLGAKRRLKWEPIAWIELRGVERVSVVRHVAHFYGRRCNGA